MISIQLVHITPKRFANIGKKEQFNPLNANLH